MLWIVIAHSRLDIQTAVGNHRTFITKSHHHAPKLSTTSTRYSLMCSLVCILTREIRERGASHLPAADRFLRGRQRHWAAMHPSWWILWQLWPGAWCCCCCHGSVNLACSSHEPTSWEYHLQWCRGSRWRFSESLRCLQVNSNTQEPIMPGERQSTDRVYFDKLKERMQNFRERVEIVEVRYVMILS